MKLKRRPEDFVVDEQTDFDIGSGPFAVYQLTKRSIGTPEAVAAIVDRWRIPRRRISYGGLKDKHAVTTQHLTIHHGPKKALSQKSFELEYLGQAERAFEPQDIRANRFTITLRDMKSDEIESAARAADVVREVGLPNYFDDQRFGSLGVSGEWIAKAWCLGDYERALWLALADPHRDDRSREKEQKRMLRELWGQWLECKAALDRSHRRSIVTYLADKQEVGKPIDFKGAFARISVDLRGLYLSAFQSALWNRMLTSWLEARIPEEHRHPCELLSGPCCFPGKGALKNEDCETELPLPSARLKLADDEPVAALVEHVAEAEGLERRQLRVKYPRDSFFSKQSRRAIIPVAALTIESDNDDLYPKRRKLELQFELPRGSYATILVKGLTQL